jgi:hypothetical protein
MFKKSMATALLVCSIPAVASASWFLSTQVKTGGGSLTTRNLAGQVVTDGAIFKSYTASTGTLAVTAAPVTGYTLQSLTVNGKVVANPANVTINGADQNIAAVFTATGFDVKTTGGTPSQLGGVYYGYELKSPVTFSFAPTPGNAVTAINTASIPVAAANFNATVITDPAKRVITSSIPGTVNKVATVTLPKGYIFTGGFNLAATQVPMVATLKPGASHVTTILGLDYAGNPNKASLTAVLTAPAGAPTYTYNWTYVSGPQNVTSLNTDGGKLSSTTGSAYTFTPGPAINIIQTPADGKASFVPAVAGQYKLLLTAHPADNSGDLVAMTTVNVVASAKDGAVNTCQFCHSANNIGGTAAVGTVGQPGYQPAVSSNDRIFKNWSASAHHGVVCSKCHAGTETGGHPGTINCANCHHSASALPVPASSAEAARDCARCHAADGVNIHAVNAPTKTSCISCHDLAAPQHTVDEVNHINGVGDNNGVRAIVGEFQKWSHHVTGVTLNDAHCAACHLEGTVSNGEIVPSALHMSDNKTHLRDTTNGTDADFAWDPTAPDFTGMDNFCLSCHDNDGAASTGSDAIRGLINTAGGKYNTGIAASATNPFGDTISNRYDKMRRPAVVDAKGQFDPSNPSHHAVRGQRYTKRTRVINAADPRAMTAAEVAAFTNNSGIPSTTKTAGARSTIYDARAKRVSNPDGYGAYNVSKFVDTYQTLTGPPTAPADKTLGDDSVLHCGDCHTVGQYRLADVGVLPKNNAVIGAHGSNNEYLLRNSIGTDERHVGQTYSTSNGVNYFTNIGAPLLVCFNCHSYQQYGTIGAATGATGTNHAGEYANSTRCNGPTNTIPFQGYTSGNETDGEQYVTRLGEGFIEGPIYGSTSTADTDYSNLFGMQCANCHNSGPNNAFGGIHGAKVQTYTDANGAAQKAYRFLPGLGNTMFVPGSVAGVGTVSDINWEQKQLGTVYDAGKTVVTDNSGCYTLVPDPADATTDSADNAPFSGSPTFEQQNSAGQNLFGTWGGCDDHRGNAHGKAFATGTTQGPGNKGWIDPTGGTYNTGGAGAVRKTLRPVTY